MTAHTTTVLTESLDNAAHLLIEVAALQEMATRIHGENEEDFDMLQRACAVSMRMIEEASTLLRKARVQ